jgi:hypothetical protein
VVQQAAARHERLLTYGGLDFGTDTIRSARVALCDAPGQVSARLPYDPQLVRAATASSARLVHSRERERAAVLRAGALPFSRTAVSPARETLGR